MRLFFYDWAPTNMLVLLTGWLCIGATLAALLKSDKNPSWLLAVAILHLFSTAFEYPIVANSSLLMSAVHIAFLIAAWTQRHQGLNLPQLLAARPTQRFLWILMTLIYVAAAFSKLNTSFVTPWGSCANSFLLKGLRQLGLPSQLPTWMYFAIPVIALTWEWLIALGFIFRRQGVVVMAIAFHLLLLLVIDSFSTASMAILLGALLPARTSSNHPGLMRKHAAFVILAGLAFFTFEYQGDRHVAYSWSRWITFGTVLALVLSEALGKKPSGQHHRDSLALTAPESKVPVEGVVPLPVRFTASFVLGLLAVFCLSPYFGWKTGLSFSMYSNLRIGPDQNHWVAPPPSEAWAPDIYQRVWILESHALYPGWGSAGKFFLTERELHRIRGHIRQNPRAGFYVSWKDRSGVEHRDDGTSPLPGDTPRYWGIDRPESGPRGNYCFW